MKKAVVLFSGGVDSTTVLACALQQGFECHALSFDYGQRHRVELEAAKKIAAHYQVAHRVFCLPLNEFGGSAQTDHRIPVPVYTGSIETPVTYTPARNTIFLSIALGLAEIIQAYDIFLGINKVDYSHYPDCRPEYLRAFQTMADLATKAGMDGATFTLHAPLMELSKAQILQLGTQLGVDYGMTVSCYQANVQGQACGVCDSCTFRKKGFQEAHLPDPTAYM